ncbi:MAG: threonine-phosphate decarboxylase [Methylocystis sp.]|nr:threonine-phosphate decarboxylase [Methylocystis sp.]MCA3583977.1 threonine-phosphate decarboxylase [Methylocystis sp.]MCA3588920.1 threonine-phosphate decarboxylase [Methylocystis sp.]MCA3592528.1 threonine-phosphate decarboxylase [Methylocystis sp.]
MLHGGDLTEAMARFGGGRGDWLDLSTGINPHAYPVPELAAELWRSLPTGGDLKALLDAARRCYRVPEQAEIVAAPGTQALIQWMPRLAPAGGAAVLGPTYNEHARAFSGTDRGVEGIAALKEWRDAANLIIVNPNNPDGRLLPLDALADCAAEAAERGGWLIIDESFIDVAPERTAVSLCARYPVVILRSFGKFYGLAGVRLGFLIAAPSIAGRFRAALGPWAVTGPALAIGEAALGDDGWAKMMRENLNAEANSMDRCLIEGQCRIIGGTPLFRLVRHPAAAALHERLAGQHIWVRRFDRDRTLLRFGLPGNAAGLARLSCALAGFAAHARLQGVMTSSPSAF